MAFLYIVFFFNYPATTDIYTYLHTLSLPDALPIFAQLGDVGARGEHAVGTGEHEDAGGGFGLGAQGVQLVDHPLVDRVAHLGPRQGGHDPVVAAVDADRVSHPRAPRSSRRPGRRRRTSWPAPVGRPRVRDVRAASPPGGIRWIPADRSEEQTSELQSLMRISYAVFCL